MYVTKFKSGKFEVKYTYQHISSNHTPNQSEAGPGFLSQLSSTKEEISMKLSLGISNNGWYAIII